MTPSGDHQKPKHVMFGKWAVSILLECCLLVLHLHLNIFSPRHPLQKLVHLLFFALKGMVSSH